jgi:hypothetical protein
MNYLNKNKRNDIFVEYFKYYKLVNLFVLNLVYDALSVTKAI